LGCDDTIPLLCHPLSITILVFFHNLLLPPSTNSAVIEPSPGAALFLSFLVIPETSCMEEAVVQYIPSRLVEYPYLENKILA